jgi:hypothetical protein
VKWSRCISCSAYLRFASEAGEWEVVPRPPKGVRDAATKLLECKAKAKRKDS